MSDLLGGESAVNADISATFDAVASGASESTPDTDTTPDVSAADDSQTEQSDAPATEAEAAPVDLEAEQPTEEAAAPTDETPEGIKQRIRNGKEEWVYTKERGKAVYDVYKTARAIEDQIGEPLTPELAGDLQTARINQDRMETDLLSGTPEGSDRLLNHFTQLAIQAAQNGQIANDPIAALASRMPQFLAERGLNNALRAQAAQYFQTNTNTFLGGLRQQLQTIADPNERQALERSLGWIEKFSGRGKQQQAQARPEVPAEHAGWLREKQEFEVRVQRDNTERWNSWDNNTGNMARTALSEEIGASVKQFEASYAPFPKQLQAMKDSLKTLLHEAVQSDGNFQSVIRNLKEQALHTRSEQVRAQKQQEIATRYRTKASLVLDPSRNPAVKELFNESARFVKASVDNTTKRLATAAQRREPGSGATPPRAAVPAPPRSPNGRFRSEEDIASEVRSLMASL